MHLKTNLKNFIPLLAIPAAIFFPQVGSVLSPFTTWILGILLFFAFLGLEPKKLLKEFRHPLEAFYMGMVVLVITPLVILPIMSHFFPEYQLGALLFMLMPSAVSSPAVAGIYGGSVALASANAVFANLLSPFTIPILIGFFAGSTVKVSLFKILYQLIILMAIPFVLSLAAHHAVEDKIQKAKKHFGFIALSLLFLLFFAALSPYKTELTSNLLNGNLWLAVLVAHLILFFFAKLMIAHVKVKKDRISIQSNIMFLNVGLAIVLAQNYFGPSEILFIIFCQISWVILVGLFKYLK